jgi:hypothetical protein
MTELLAEMKPNLKMMLSVSAIKKVIFCTFFIMLISLPFAYKEFKIVLLILLLLFALLNANKYLTTVVNKDLLYIFIIFFVANCFFILIGIFNNNIGVFPTLPVNLIWPILYFIILLDARFYIDYKEIVLILKISLTIISIYILIFYLNELVGFPISINSNLVHHSIDYNDSKATANQIAMPAATCLFFLVPFFMTVALLSRENKLSDYIFLFLGVAISLATGRRALILLIVFSPLIIFFLALILPYGKISILNRILKKILIMFFLFSIAVVVLEKNKIIDMTFLVKKTVTFFVPSHSGLEEGAVIRNAQKDALMNKWRQRPLFGFGFGGTANNYIRNPKTPWAYELSYVTKLMNIGIIGMGIYFLYIVFLVLKLSYHLKNNYVFFLSAITGFLTILIANSSNPYLDSFEYMWMIYFQVLFILIAGKDQIRMIKEAKLRNTDF